MDSVGITYSPKPESVFVPTSCPISSSEKLELCWRLKFSLSLSFLPLLLIFSRLPFYERLNE